MNAKIIAEITVYVEEKEFNCSMNNVRALLIEYLKKGKFHLNDARINLDYKTE